MNMKFEYLYRDAGNNKIWGNIVFTNHDKTNSTQIDSMLRKALIDGEFFHAKESKLPKLAFDSFNQKLDHDWYEYSQVSDAIGEPNDPQHRDIKEFIVQLSQSHQDTNHV